MKPKNNINLIAESMETDIRNYADYKRKYETYKVFKEKTESSIIDKMELLGISEVGKIKLIETPCYKSVPIKDTLDLLIDKKLNKLIYVNVDLEKTKQSLKINAGMSESKANAVIQHLEMKMNDTRKELIINND